MNQFELRNLSDMELLGQVDIDNPEVAELVTRLETALDEIDGLSADVARAEGERDDAADQLDELHERVKELEAEVETLRVESEYE